MEDPDSPVSTRIKLQAHLKFLDEVFLKSVAHKGFVEAVEREIEQTEEAIILNEPFDRKSEIESFKMRGDLRTLERFKTTFEDARVTLKQRIEEMLERENQNAENKEKPNEVER